MYDATHTGSDAGSGSRAAPPVLAGKYRILEEIGRGAMGTVFRAHDSALDRTVAVKTIAARHDGGSSVSERFRREARLAASLNHPNIVTVYDFDEAEHGFYMVMELLDGADLAAVLRLGRLTTLEDKLEVIEQLVEGVAFAHERGLVHRDLKPANVFRAKGGRIKILDFGLARSDEPCLTTVGSVLGTPRYMAPEQVRGEPADTRSDVFSLGAMLYEILAGESPFPATSVHAAIFQVMERQPPALDELDAGVPPLLARVVDKALAKRPQRRFRDACELRQALAEVRQVLRGESSESRAFAGLGLKAGARRSDAGPVSSSRTALPQVAAAAGPLRLTFSGEPGGDRQLVLRQPGKKSLLDCSLGASIPHFHECGGRARCSTCRVRVISGKDGLTPRNRLEAKLAERLGWSDDIRLACQARPVGDVTVKRLIRDSDDFGLLRFESRQARPQERALAILTCTVHNFAEISRQAAPYDVVHILNRYFLQIGEPILSGGGQIERYAGEGLVASFGQQGGRSRDHCLAAVRAALRILARLEDLNRYARSYFQAELEVGIGLAFGRVIVGQVGHPSRQRPTMIGTAPRLARWLSRLTRDHGVPILAAEDLINVIEDDLDLGEVITEAGPEGREVTSYEVRDFKKPDAVLIAQSSFEALARRRDEVAELFYRLLFQIDPSTEPLFAGVDMASQGEMLVDVLAHVVRGLENLDELRPVVADLGRRHAGYGVELHHYDSVEQALLETMRQLLGSAFTDDVRLAWSRVYNELAKIMIEASEMKTAPVALVSPQPAAACPMH